MVKSIKPTRRARAGYIKQAVSVLNSHMPRRIWFNQYGQRAGFQVEIPSHLIEAEDQKTWEAFEQRCADLDEEAYEAEHIRRSPDDQS
jgi:hypothetical protein